MTTIATKEKSKEAGMLTNEKFPLQNRSLHLSIEVRENDLLACLLDKHSNQYIAFTSLKFDAKSNPIENLAADPVLSSKASDNSIAFTPNSALLVPAPFFKKELLNDYLGFQQLEKQNETPCYDYIKNLDSYNIYTVNNEVLSFTRKHFPNASFRHNSSIFIEYILIENKHSADSKVFVSVGAAYFDVVVIKAGKLILSNRFYYSNSSDFIYHLLWVYEQLNLDNEKVTCTFYGDIDKGSETFSLSSNYIKKASLGTKNEQLNYSQALSTLPAHKYRSLFTQYLCV